ncbi:MAG: hypothetical protein AB1512_26950 [Thermodesulfobacteriota bacterium]
MHFCDMTCRHARWPEADHLDGSGSCRTFQALFCAKRRALVYKNAPCPEKQEKRKTGPLRPRKNKPAERRERH